MGEVADQVEAEINARLKSIVFEVFQTEGNAFGARTLGDNNVKLTWQAKHVLQVAAANLSVYPHALCQVGIKEVTGASTSAPEAAKSKRTAQQRAMTVKRYLETAGCCNPFELHP